MTRAECPQLSHEVLPPNGDVRKVPKRPQRHFHSLLQHGIRLHPSGTLVSKIISDKIAELEEKKSRGEVQGMDASGFFAYDKCNFAELKLDSANLQEVFVLLINGPWRSNTTM